MSEHTHKANLSILCNMVLNVFVLLFAFAVVDARPHNVPISICSMLDAIYAI